jgi:hypothetical protein
MSGFPTSALPENNIMTPPWSLPRFLETYRCASSRVFIKVIFSLRNVRLFCPILIVSTIQTCLGFQRPLVQKKSPWLLYGLFQKLSRKWRMCVFLAPRISIETLLMTVYVCGCSVLRLSTFIFSIDLFLICPGAQLPFPQKDGEESGMIFFKE